MNDSNYDENNDVNVSPIQNSNINEPVINNNYEQKSEEELLEENMIMTSLNGQKLDDDYTNDITQYDLDNNFNQNISSQTNNEEMEMTPFDISPDPINNAIHNYDNLENELDSNNDVEKTISITPLEERILKEFINDLSEDGDEISIEDLKEEIDLLENPSIDNDRLKFFVDQLSNNDKINYEEGLEKLSEFKGINFLAPLSMGLKPDPSSDFINLKPNEKAKEEKKEIDAKSENPPKEEKERRIDLDKRAREVNKKTESEKQQPPQQSVKESILSSGIRMLQRKNKNKSNEESVDNEEDLNLSSSDKIDSITNDIKTLNKNFQSYNLMDDNDPNKSSMKSYIEKRISEIGDKMDNNPITDKDLEADPKKTQTLEKSTSKLNKNMKKTKNSDINGLKDFKERMSNFLNNIKKVVSYVMSKIKGNNSTISP